MIKTRVVVVDTSEGFINSIKDSLSSSNQMMVVSSFTNGLEAYKYMTHHYNEFDLIITDILLPGIDGITMINKLREKEINKKVIIASYYNDEKMISDCISADIDFFMMKPINYDYLKNKIKELFLKKVIVKNTTSSDLEVAQILHNLGIPSHIRGYQYIRDSIEIVNKDEQNKFITKDVYPQIAYKYNTTISRVERAIRHAIEMSCIRGDLELMEELFGFSVSSERSKPTNSEFIVTIADRIKIDNKIRC